MLYGQLTLHKGLERGATQLVRGNSAVRPRAVSRLSRRVLAATRSRARVSRRVRHRAHERRLDGSAHPDRVRRRRTRPRRSVGHHGGDQPERRELRRVPRTALQHGDAAAARLGRAEARVPPAHRERRVASSVDGRDRTHDRNRTRRRRRRWPFARATTTSSTARRSGCRARIIRI